MKKSLSLLLTTAAMVLAGPANAQTEEAGDAPTPAAAAPTPAAAAPTPAAAASTPAAAAPAPAKPAEGEPAKQTGLPPKAPPSPLREQCEAEMKKDKEWLAMVKNRIRPEVHKEDAERMTNNYKHVVAAYVVIWGFTILFLALMWMRQQRLNRDIERLENELARALERESGSGS